jgi:hypothetical protein
LKPNPLLDLPENVYASARFHDSVSFLEKTGLVGVFLVGGLLAVISMISAASDLWNFKILNAVIDVFVLLLAFSMIFYSYKSIKRVLLMDSLVDLAFQEQLYQRLEPLLSNIAKTHVEFSELRKRMNNLDLKMRTLLHSQYSREVSIDALLSREPVAVGTSLKFTIRAIFVSVVSITTFILLLIPGIPFPHYIFLFIFFLWWLFLTSEYKLWKHSTAWGFLFLPVLVVPITFMIVANLYANLFNLVIAIFYILTGAYIFVYYLWTVYETTGSLPLFFESSLRRREDSEFFKLQRQGFFHDIISAVKVKLLSQLPERPLGGRVQRERRFFPFKKR